MWKTNKQPQQKSKQTPGPHECQLHESDRLKQDTFSLFLLYSTFISLTALYEQHNSGMWGRHGPAKGFPLVVWGSRGEAGRVRGEEGGLNMDEKSHRREVEPVENPSPTSLLQRGEIQVGWRDGKVRGHPLSVEGPTNWSFSRGWQQRM